MNLKHPAHSLVAGILAVLLLSTSAFASDSADVITTALGEVGYTEGADEYSKYGEWYGLPNSYWCDMFVSWCAMKSGVPKDQFPRHCSCTTHVKLFSQLDQYRWSAYRGSTYIPQQGDVIFFYRYQSDPKGKNSNHTGLVLYVEDGYVYTIEGNALTNRLDYPPATISELRDDKVEPLDHVVVNRYPLNAPQIHGYGIPAYDSRTPVVLDGFVDLGKHAENAGIFKYMCDSGLMSATSSHTFSPELGMTRGEFMKLVADFFGIPDWSMMVLPYDDVPREHPCYSAIMSTRASGLTNDIAGNRFQPDIYIAPSDAQAILDRALAYMGVTEQFNFSDGDFSYMLTPYTIRADIAKAFYTLCMQMPLSEEFAGQVVLGENECPARSLNGVCYVPLESLLEAVPGLGTPEILRTWFPNWGTDRVQQETLTVWYGEEISMLDGFSYHGTAYVDLYTAAGILPLECQEVQTAEDGLGTILRFRCVNTSE